MKTERNILIAFLLNISFAIFEFFGGLYTGSVAIMSDAVHDLGDGVSIGISYILERRSKKQPDETHTYGYGRYSVMGGVITTLILLIGSAMMLYNGIRRLIYPVDVNYGGMLLFAIVGVCVNLGGALFTRGGKSINQHAVNLHMLEDVLGWLAVLVGAVVIKFTGWNFIDPVISVGVSLFIFINALSMLKEAGELFLEKTPHGLSLEEIREHLTQIPGVADVHHIHLWAIDSVNYCATLHLVTDADPREVKALVRQELHEHGIGHVTIETETTGDLCDFRHCHMETEHHSHHCRHGHHSH